MMQAKEIMGMLRQRHPFILIDRIIEIDPGRSCTALKNVTLTEPCFQGHFPDDPVFPGVYIIEAMAQAGGVIFYAPGTKRHLVLAAVDKAKFVREVLPGDTMILSCALDKSFGAFAKVSITVTVADAIVAKGEITYGFRQARE
jgi:beta-hydroxyacyl-ACP dehydratase FabZ